MREAIREWLLAGRASGWSIATCNQYRWHLDRCQTWLADHGAHHLADLTSVLLREYAASLADAYAPATRRVAAIALRSFLRWCAEEGCLPNSAALLRAIRVPRVPQQAQRTMTSQEVSLLLAACEEPAPNGLSDVQARAVSLRNAAIIALLFDALLRSHELCRLQVSDVDMVRQRVLVRGKGGKRSWVRFGEDTAGRLLPWLAVRPGFAASPILFCGIGGNTPGGPLTTNGLRAILRRLGRRAGVDHVSPHAFRRGGAVAQLEAGAPSRLVQLHGRWDNLEMVEVYTRQIEADRLFDAYSPMAHLNGKGDS